MEPLNETPEKMPPPSQISEGTPNWNNRTLFHGDNLDVMRGMNSASVDLIATDPPFKKGRDFHATPDKLGRSPKFQDRWSWEKDVHTEWLDQIKNNHEAVWEVIDAANAVYMRKTKKNLARQRDEVGSDMGAFLCFMAVRLLEMRRLLKPTGSIFLHCDWTASHYLKATLDAIFGKNNFQNEIVWCYKDVGGGRNTNYYKKKHDIIFWYVKDDKKKKINKLARGLLSETTVDRFGSLFDNNGIITYRKLKDQRPREFASRKAQGRVPENLDDVFLSKKHGRLLEDHWNDIKPIRKRRNKDNPKEPYRYPTQKPIKLYGRLIETASELDDIVLDPFCGCATTCVAAEKLNRKWVGIDIWEKAHEVVLDRIKGQGLSQEEEDAFTLFVKNFHYETKLPERTDGSDDPSIAYLEPIYRRNKAEWEKLSDKEIKEILQVAQDWNKDGLIECAGCGRDLEKEFMELDHISPKSEGGRDTIDNRVLLCSPCNKKKRADRTMKGLWNENKKVGWMQKLDIAQNALTAARNAAEKQKMLLP